MTQKKTRISRIPCAISEQGPTNYPLHFVGHRHNQCIVMSFESDLNKTASTEEHDYYTVDKHDHIQILLAYIRYDQILAAKQEPTKNYYLHTEGRRHYQSVLPCISSVLSKI
jgi:hypothetical protein